MIKDATEFYRQSKQDHLYFCENGLWILTDKFENIPFKVNNIQKKLHTIAQEELKNKGYIRCIVLKARRHGLSTYIASRAFNHITLRENSLASILAHEQKATNRIFRMVKHFYTMLPLDKEYLPELKKDNRNEMEYEDNHSFLEVFTAGKEHSARSGGYTFIHGSEVAFYPSPEQLINMIQGVKQIPNTEIWFESTANGMGNFFHKQYMMAKGGGNDYRAVFFAWFEHEEYSMPFRSKLAEEEFKESVHAHKKIDKYGEEEGDMKLYGLTYQQLNWRRYYIDNYCQGHPTLSPLDYFKQEMPSNDIEAFVTTGGTVFKISIILHNKKLCKEPIARGGLRFKTIEKKEPEWYEDAGGEIKVWRLPDSQLLENRYCAGLDPSGGVLESDFSSASVMDRTDHFVCATWHGYADDYKMAEQLYLLSLFYNRDIHWYIEKNAYGDPIINRLYHDWKYKKLCLLRKLDIRHEKINTDVIGFNMNRKTKPIVIGQLNEWIREGLFTDYDEDFWKECETFIYGRRLANSTYYEMSAMNKGKAGHSERCYDDRIFGRALMIEADRVMPNIKQSNANMPKWMKKQKAKKNEPSSYLTA